MNYIFIWGVVPLSSSTQLITIAQKSPLALHLIFNSCLFKEDNHGKKNAGVRGNGCAVAISRRGGQEVVRAGWILCTPHVGLCSLRMGREGRGGAWGLQVMLCDPPAVPGLCEPWRPSAGKAAQNQGQLVSRSKWCTGAAQAPSSPCFQYHSFLLTFPFSLEEFLVQLRSCSSQAKSCKP